METEDRRLETALEAIRQQITLATAILGAMLAFSDQLSGARQGQIWKSLPWVFVPMAASSISGILALQSVAFFLKTTRDPLAAPLVRGFGIIQNVTFILAVAAMTGILLGT